MPPVYTIGYQALQPAGLARIVTGLGAMLVDCRSKPFSKKPGFNKDALRKLLGARYVWKGRELGGRSSISKSGIAWIKQQTTPVILLCMEEAPGDCHRHHAICRPFFPDALHIYRDELVTAAELQRALDEDDGYCLQGFLSELLHSQG